MAGFSLKGDEGLAFTCVPDWFIERFMAQANGEFVKVYLLLLKNLDRSLDDLSLSDMADCLDQTEKDVFRALRYWEKAGLLFLDYGEGKKLSAVRFASGEPKQLRQKSQAEKELAMANSPIDQQNMMVKAPAKSAKAAVSIGKATRDRLIDNEEFTQLLYIVQRYMEKTLTEKECDVFIYLYDVLKFPSEMIEFLVEYCVGNGHRNSRYMEVVALDWHKKNILTIEQAKKYAASFKKDTFAVMRAFGLSHRSPAASEQELIDKWLHTDHYSLNIVLEACDRTMKAIHQPSFEYAGKILTQWKSAGVKSLADIEKLDEQRQQSKNAVRERKGKDVSAKKGKSSAFLDFEQRTYDYDELLKKINGF